MLFAIVFLVVLKSAVNWIFGRDRHHPFQPDYHVGCEDLQDILGRRNKGEQVLM
jgi:hypothetical protein